MLAILSPAKNMRPASFPGLAPRKPSDPERTIRLAALLRGFSPWQLESMLKINPELALRAYEDFQTFDWERPGSPALLSYYGLAYRHLNAGDFTPEQFGYADRHLRLLSAFYGMLRPADEIQPYRLELQCAFRPEGRTLYEFWGDRICRRLFESGEPVVNLASGEYERAVTPWMRPGDRMITCRFMTMRRGKLTTLATEAKMARGRMARFLVKNRIGEPEGLRAFDWDGYQYQPHLSSETIYVFVR